MRALAAPGCGPRRAAAFSMAKEKEFPVFGNNGLKGTLLAAARFLDASPEKRIRLEDGREIVVPSSALIAQPDGSYFLNQNEQVESLPQAPPVRPANAHAPPVEAAIVEPPLTAATAAQLFREDCDVERVSIKRIIDRPAEIRHEGDTLIVPLMEEVLVVEKRLMLREELHIKRRREHKADGATTPIPKEELSA